MSKAFAALYAFNASARTVTIADLATVTPESLILITNTTTGDVIYQFNRPELGAAFSGNTITLEFDTTAMSNTDRLQIIYDDMQARQVIGNTNKKFRDGFAKSGTQPNPAIWNLTNTGGHIITQGGNSSGSTYLRISLNPLTPDTEVVLTAKDSIRMPVRVGAGVSASQRASGQEFFWGVVGDDGSGGVDTSTVVPADITVTGATMSVTSNVATFTVTNHGLTGNERIIIYGATDSRCNVGPTYATILDANSFTVAITMANGSYNCTGAMIRYAEIFRNAYNGAGYLWENTTVTNATTVVRRNGCKPRLASSQTVGTITAVQQNTSPYTDAFNPGAVFEVELRVDETSFRTLPTDSNAQQSSLTKFNQIPEEDSPYHLQFRAKNLKNLSVPVGRITNATKSGSTTATITTDVAHGLIVGDSIQVVGIRDQTNFANTTSGLTVVSVPDSTHFTAVFGASATASSAGGGVWKVQATTGIAGLYNISIQSISRTGNIMSVVANGAWTTPLPGEYVYLYGMDGATAYEGGYKVLRVNNATLEVASTGADFTSVNTGGTGFRMTDLRIHFAKSMDYTRLVAEIVGGRGNITDINNAVPVSIAGSTSIAVQQTSTPGTVANTWSAAGSGGALSGDVLSAAITTTTTSSTINPGNSANIGCQSHEFNITVTAVSGTNPTMDVVVQESPDGGTNWLDIYHFPRITTTGLYVSPSIPNTHGTRYRYIRTIGGTTPSFTHSVNRVQFSHRSPLIRQFFDRSITLTTLNSTTPIFNVDGCRHIMLAVAIAAVTTTAPALQLQGSEDNSLWYNLGAPLTAVASSVVVLNVVDVLPKYVRALVSTAGVGVTSNYVTIKGIGY